MPVANTHYKFDYEDDHEDDVYFTPGAKSDWSLGCEGAPWWVDIEIESAWKNYLDGQWSLSSCTPDAASLGTYEDQLVFVYGTLKRGFPCHDLLSEGEFLGRGWTKTDSFKLVQTEKFPAAVMGASGPVFKHIAGEVYIVPTTEIKNLDQYESNGTLFHRRRVGIDLETGNSVLAWMYIANEKIVQSVTKLCPMFTRKKTGAQYYSYTKEGAKK